MSAWTSMFAPGLFEGQVCLVTGGASGIGLACGRELVALGARIAICGRNEARLAAGTAELEALARGASTSAEAAPNERVFGARCDIREPPEVADFVGKVLARFGRIDVLINNAGGQFPSPAEHLSPRGWDAVVRNNLNGTFYMTREVATRAMIPQKRGRIVMVTAGVSRGFPGMSHTGAARAGVENLAASLSIEWAAHGIRVNTVAPGNNIRSSGTDQYGDALLELARRATPLRRHGTPEEVARVILFLASDRNDFVTGAVFRIDGGQQHWGDVWQIADDAPAAPPEPNPSSSPDRS